MHSVTPAHRRRISDNGITDAKPARAPISHEPIARRRVEANYGEARAVPYYRHPQRGGRRRTAPPAPRRPREWTKTRLWGAVSGAVPHGSFRYSSR